MKLNSSGALQWILQTGVVGSDISDAVQIESSGDIVVAGHSMGSFAGYTNAGDWDFVVMKLNSSGALQWLSQTGTSGTDFVRDAQVEGSGDIVLAGHSTGSFEGYTNAGDFDMVVMKLNSSGALQWTFQIGTSATDNLRAVQVESSGSIVVAGHSEQALHGQTSMGDYDMVIMELNSQGTLLWLCQTGTGTADYAHAVQVDSSGDIVLAGHSLGSFEGYTTAGGFDMVVLKIGKPTTTTTKITTTSSSTTVTGTSTILGTSLTRTSTTSGTVAATDTSTNSATTPATRTVSTTKTSTSEAATMSRTTSTQTTATATSSTFTWTGETTTETSASLTSTWTSSSQSLTTTQSSTTSSATSASQTSTWTSSSQSLTTTQSSTTSSTSASLTSTWTSSSQSLTTTRSSTTSSAISSAKNASTGLTSTSSSSWTTLTFTPGGLQDVGAAVSAAVESLATAQAEFAELFLGGASDGLQQGVQDAHGQSIVGVAFEVTGSDVMFENDDISVHLAAASLPRMGNLVVISTARVHGGGMLAKLIQAYNGAASAVQLAEPVSLHISATGPSSMSLPVQLTMPITKGSDEFVPKACVAWDVSTDAWTTDGVALNASDDFSVTCSIWLSFGENASGRRLDALQPSLFSYISPSLSPNESFPWAVVLPIVTAVVIPVLAMLMWKFRRKRARIEPACNVEEDDFPQERIQHEPRPDSIEMTQVESLPDTGSAAKAVAVGADSEAPVDTDLMIRSLVKKEEGVDCDEGDIQAATEAGAMSIQEQDAAKPVKKARLAMVSARFNARNWEVEQKFRRVCQILRARDLEVLMVNAGGAQDFGKMTMQYLNQLKVKKGVMLAVCTSDYAEMTSSPYSSHAELKYALDNDIEILPLKVEATFPPEPPWGENHPKDKKGIACGLVDLAIPGSTVFVDCLGQSDVWIADEIEKVLRRSSSEFARGRSGHGTKSELGSTTQ